MLKDVIYYILEKHWELPNARITKLVFLSDWKSCLDNQSQITNINWYFDYYWPFVRDIENEIDINNDLFSMKEEYNQFWSKKKIFSAKPWYQPVLDDNLKNVIDFVINLTKELDFNSFIKFIYSTYPIYKSRKFTFLNLIDLAEEYKKIS